MTHQPRPQAQTPTSEQLADALYASLRDQMLHTAPSHTGPYAELLRAMEATQTARRALRNINPQED